MPDLTWSKEPPKVAGVYWHRVSKQDKGLSLSEVRVEPLASPETRVMWRDVGYHPERWNRGRGWRDEFGWAYTTKAMRWAGPIPEPKEPGGE